MNVQGSTVGTYTLEDGSFTIIVPNGPQVLIVRRIGFKRATTPISATTTTVEIRLERDVLQLETQVVTGTATAVSSVNAANAVAVVSGEQLNRVPSPTLDNALQGKVAGAIISQNSGAPGGGTQIQIRGVSTINAGYSPLYVVDGVIVNNQTIQNGLNVISQAARGNLSSSQDQSVNRIADLNPENIENIQVLKGPSASSIYGSKGANGVIIITTKRGSTGAPQFNITQRIGKYVLANKIGSRCFRSGAEYADWAADVLGSTNRAADIAMYDAAANKCHDYEEEFYGANKQLAYQTNLSLSGGTASGTSYLLTGTIQQDNGLALTDFYRKQSVRLNVGQSVGSRITLRANSELIHTLTQRGISGNDNAGINPYTVFSSTPSFFDMRKSADGTYPVNPFGTTNPFQNAEIVKTPENVYRALLSLTGTLSIYSSERQTLDYTMTGGIDTYADRARIVSPATSYTEQNFNGANAGTLFNSDANVLNANLNGTFAHRYTTAPFTATTSAGFREEHNESVITQITGRGVVFPTLTAIDQAAQTFPDQTQTLDKGLAFFLQEEFLTLDERLLLTAGLNAERTSNNGNPTRYYSYPKFSASYRVPALPSMIDELKVRAAYGLAGNQPTAGRFTFLTTSLYEGRTGARASTIQGAESIKPETSRETEGGFDLTMFGSRARLGATMYRKEITDLLLTAPLAPTTGFTSKWINGGKIVNAGVELELAGTPVSTPGFTWISNTTFSQSRGKVVSLPSDVAPFNPGVGSFSPRYGNAWIEAGQSTGAIQTVNGCAVPLSASGVCPAASRILAVTGEANPDFTMGFSNDFQFGPVRVASLFDWRKGGDVVNLTNNYFDSGNIAKDTLASQKRAAGFAAALPVYLEDAGFVKLREVSVSYALSPSMVQRAFAGRARDVRLELVGRNLLTWTNYTGLDPEVSNFGNQALGRFQDVTPYPPSRSFFFSIAASF